MMNLIGLSYMSSSETWFVLMVAFCGALAIGYLFHVVMGHVGFGIGGNTVVTMVAMYAGLYAYHRFTGQMQSPNATMLIGFVLASIMAHLLVLSTLRRTLKL